MFLTLVCFDLCFFSRIDVLVKLHYYSVVVVVVVVVRGIVRIIQKDDPGLIFVPSLCFHYYTLLGRIQFNIHTWFVCLLLFIQKDVLDMTWFDLVCVFYFFKCRGPTKMEIRLFMVFV